MILKTILKLNRNLIVKVTNRPFLVCHPEYHNKYISDLWETLYTAVLHTPHDNHHKPPCRLTNPVGQTMHLVTHRHYQSQSLRGGGCGQGSGGGLSGPPAAASLSTSLSAFQHHAERGSLSLSH